MSASIVPTPRTRALAAIMVAQAQQTTGADAALAHIGKVHTDQLPALIGVLLTSTKPHRRIGRTRLPLVYSEADRRKANRQYKAGMRDDWTVAGWREYQRVAQQARTQRVGRTGR